MTICRFVADTKNSIGLAGCIEEVAHNAIAVYWNPLESAAKVQMHISSHEYQVIYLQETFR